MAPTLEGRPPAEAALTYTCLNPDCLIPTCLIGSGLMVCRSHVLTRCTVNDEISILIYTHIIHSLHPYHIQT